MENETQQRDPKALAEQLLLYLSGHPQATVMDVMAEFDLSDDEAWSILAYARHYNEMPGDV